MHVYGYYNIEEVSPWNSPWESPQPRHLLRMRTLLFTARYAPKRVRLVPYIDYDVMHKYSLRKNIINRRLSSTNIIKYHQQKNGTLHQSGNCPINVHPISICSL